MSRDNDIATMETFYEKELEDARSKERRAQEELKSFKQRMAGVLPLTLRAGDTEDMTTPVNKSRLQDMYDTLRVNELPKVTQQLAEEGLDASIVQQLLQNAFEEAASVVCCQLESMNEMFTGKRFNRDVPQKVKEYLSSCRQSLQMAFYHCNKKDLQCSAVKEAPEVSREFLHECYWLGCLMALSRTPIQPNWKNHHKGMDPWDILPRSLTPIPQNPMDKRKMDGPNDGPPHRSESVHSDWSIDRPINFATGSTSQRKMDGPNDGPPHRSESMHSDWSIDRPINFATGSTSQRKMDGPNDGPPHRSEPMHSDWSIDRPINFATGSTSQSGGSIDDHERKREEDQETFRNIEASFQRLEKDIAMFVTEQLKSFFRLLTSDEPQSTSEREEHEQSSRDAVLNITLDFMQRMKQKPLADRLLTKTVVRGKMKSQLQQRFSQVYEGVAKPGSSVPLKEIYTELYITEGGTSEVNQEHEVRHIQTMSRRTTDTPISPQDIFKHPETEKPIRTVLTMGVAGVGKTVLTQKFSLDWAEDQANQDMDLLFPFTFRELNVLRDTEHSLVELLHHFFSHTRDLSSFEDLQVVFILDGLDEYRLPLDFSRTRVITDPTEKATVEELLVNLIRGNLLPFARIWITTRPAAANQIPAECVSMVTAVPGFNDLQKEQYFKNRIPDEQQATEIIKHIKSNHSLFIMSNIPIFSWIVSTVLLHLKKTAERGELPKTLTQMYIHFLVVQAKVRNMKYHGGSGADFHWTEETKTMVRSLAKLAFEQLLKGNLIFYESDVRESGLDAAEIACYSGVFTKVFREESGLYQNKVYCFIHLTVQEFLAALHVHQEFFSAGLNLLSPQCTMVFAFYRSAVDQALKSPNGHLDLFLRFLLGLSLPTNQSLLKGLLTEPRNLRHNYELIKYIKQSLNEDGLSTERSLNLLHCLNELNDRSLVEEIQKVMRDGGLYNKRMSSAQWSALSFLLLSSDLKEFDLRRYCPSEEALKRLMPVVKATNKVILSCCNLTVNSCGPLASVLSSSTLTHLDLSNNDLQDSGVEQLCEGLKSATCRLENLGLSGCLLTEKGGDALVLALKSTSSPLTEMDLRYNHLGASSEKLTALLFPEGPLKKLRMTPTGEKWNVPGLKKYFCGLSLNPITCHRRLQLSEGNSTVTFVKTEQYYPYHRHRFESTPQVLCSNALSEPSYWEVNVDMDLANTESVFVAVNSSGIAFKETMMDREFGATDDSWALKISKVSYSVSHGGEEIRLSQKPHYRSSSHSKYSNSWFRTTVAVYLDYTGGSLSFFEINEGKMTLIYTYHSSFTLPLFAGFRLNDGTVSLVKKTRLVTH